MTQQQKDAAWSVVRQRLPQLKDAAMTAVAGVAIIYSYGVSAANTRTVSELKQIRESIAYGENKSALDSAKQTSRVERLELREELTRTSLTEIQADLRWIRSAIERREPMRPQAQPQN